MSKVSNPPGSTPDPFNHRKDFLDFTTKQFEPMLLQVSDQLAELERMKRYLTARNLWGSYRHFERKQFLPSS